MYRALTRTIIGGRLIETRPMSEKAWRHIRFLAKGNSTFGDILHDIGEDPHGNNVFVLHTLRFPFVA